MVSPRILVIDDEADLRELLEITLVRMGLDVDSVASLRAARQRLTEHEYALVLTDMRLGDGLGIELVHEITAHYKNTPVAVITAFGSADNAVIALKAGAFDYLSKPVALDHLRAMVQSALRTSASNKAATPADSTSQQIVDDSGLRLRGQSQAMQELRAQIVRLARSMAPVAIFGESGSGKELAARDIHALSARSDKPFIAVNCGAIPEALMEAEFFGYRKGAFTGANEERNGFFQAANGGTLLLDEIADLPLPMQVKLLRAIQERRVRKVGATTEDPVDVRLISATHQNLELCVEGGRFRQDLYYRLNVIGLNLPALRERTDDIDLLSTTILDRLTTNDARTVLSAAALQALHHYAFPGNVRELENILERALAFANHGVIEVDDLALRGSTAPQSAITATATAPTSVNSPTTSSTYTAPQSAPSLETDVPVAPSIQQHAIPSVTEPNVLALSEPDNFFPGLPLDLVSYLDKIESQMIRQALTRTRFNRTAAAELLGLSFRQLRYRMQRLEIYEPE
jgi:two-component system response regulator PilR (NtrC family)